MTTIQQHIDRIKEANKITNRKTLYAAGAGLIPFPIVDTATLLGVQLTMIQSIAKLYDIEFKEHIAKSLIGSLISSISSVSLVKLVPGIGTILGSATASLAGATGTYALGRVFTQHFDQGGTLLDFDPISSRAYFQKEYEAGHLFVSQQNLIDSTASDNNTAENDLSLVATKTEKELLLAETEQIYAVLLNLKETLDSLIAQQTATETKSVAAASINKVANFTMIEGIGPKIDEVLKAAGIYSMENLSKTKASKLQQILKDAEGNFNFADPTSWPKQAALAAAGKMGELKKWQDELIGGKIKSK